MNMRHVEKHDGNPVVLSDEALDAPSHKALLHQDSVRPTGGTAEESDLFSKKSSRSRNLN